MFTDSLGDNMSTPSISFHAGIERGLGALYRTAKLSMLHLPSIDAWGRAEL
jgi:hypothetical protein